MCREKRQEVDTGRWGLSGWATAAPPAFMQFSCSAKTVWARKTPFWLELIPSGNSQPESGVPDEFTISPTNPSHPTSSVTFADCPQLHCPHWSRAWQRLGSKAQHAALCEQALELRFSQAIVKMNSNYVGSDLPGPSGEEKYVWDSMFSEKNPPSSSPSSLLVRLQIPSGLGPGRWPCKPSRRLHNPVTSVTVLLHVLPRTYFPLQWFRCQYRNMQSGEKIQMEKVIFPSIHPTLRILLKNCFQVKEK